MTPEDMVGAALAVAEAGLAAGEQPIGAVVVMGDDVVGRAYTQERALRRRLVHADLLAMVEADRALGFGRRQHPLRLAVTLEPCVMCLGTAMALGVEQVYFSLESPSDGGAWIAATWRPDPPVSWFGAPAVVGGVRREESRSLFRRFHDTAPDSAARRWVRTLLDQPPPDPPTR